MWVRIENDYRLSNGSIVIYEAEGEVISDETTTIVQDLTISFAIEATEDFKNAVKCLAHEARAIEDYAAGELIDRAREQSKEAS